MKEKSGHRNLKHPTKPGRVTIPMHGEQEVSAWLLARIIAQAGLTAEEFKKLL